MDSLLPKLRVASDEILVQAVCFLLNYILEALARRSARVRHRRGPSVRDPFEVLRVYLVEDERLNLRPHESRLLVDVVRVGQVVPGVVVVLDVRLESEGFFAELLSSAVPLL